MKRKVFLLTSLLCILMQVSISPSCGYKKDYGFGFMIKYDPNFRDKREAETSLNSHIQSIINHYKQEDPVGLPSEFGSLVLDPLPVENLNRKFSGVNMFFRDVKVYGFSRFRLVHLKSDLSDLKINIKISMDELQVMGKYWMSAWISKSSGNFNVTVLDAVLEVDGEMMVTEEGFLQVRQMKTNLNFGDLQMNFEKLGFLMKVFQGIVNSVGVFIFDSIKPTIWHQVESKFTDILNKEARNIPQQFPNSISPVDQAVANGRKLIHERGLDPLPLADYATQNSKWSTFELNNGYLYGLSSLRRTGPVLVGFERNTIFLTVHLGLENVKGKYDWRWTALRGVLGRSGSINFSVDSISLAIRLQQSANLENKPTVESMNMTLGQASIISDGMGAVDYVLEMIFNVVPNMFRQRIAEAAEYPVSQAIEDELRKLNIEELVEETV